MSRIENAYQQFCKKRFPLPSKKQVAKLERRIGIQLPSDYRQYLLEYNGGFFTEPRIAPPEEGCPLDRLTFLSGIGASTPSAEFASEANLALFDDNEPPQLIPIGYTMMGNLLYLITSAENNGWIGMKKAFSDDCWFLAEGIADFFGLLQNPPGEDRSA